MIGPRHHRAAAGLFHASQDRLGIGRNHNGSDISGLGAPQHMHNHRLAGDVGERFAGQPGGGQAGRNQD
jgi:hypothetical protein